MIDDAVLTAVASALDRGGDVDAAQSALRRVDPLLRSSARRRLREAHADALLVTRVKHGPEGARHGLRLTYLLVARALPPRGERDDVAAVEAAYEATRAARSAGRRRGRAGFWWPTVLVSAVLAAGGGASATVLARRGAHQSLPSPARSPVGEPVEPLLHGAFARGGVPPKGPGDAAIARALGTDAPAFLIALDQRSEARRAGAGAAELARIEVEMNEARARALAPEVREALGAGAARALDDLLSSSRRASESPAGPLDAAFAQSVSALDDALAANEIGYFVDGDVITDGESGRRLVLVYTFRVVHVTCFAAGETTVRAYHLRRLDKLNWSHSLLGFSRPTLRAAAVLLDQLDEQVVTLIAPALERGAPMPLFEPEVAEDGGSAPRPARKDPPADRAVVEARAGELVRVEYGALPGLDTDAAAKLGKLLGERRALVASFQQLAAARGLTLSAPATRLLPEGFTRSLEGLVPRDDLRELALIDTALDDRTRADAFTALRDALVSSVERHEVQHRLDAIGPALPMPPVLEARVGPLERAGEERRGAARARDELSAYLAELARDPRTPRVGLTLLARFLFDQRMHGAAECYAALTIVEGLAEALGVSAGAPLLADGAIDRHAVGQVWLALVALPPERLREAARRLWETLFARPLPELHQLPSAEPPP